MVILTPVASLAVLRVDDVHVLAARHKALLALVHAALAVRVPVHTRLVTAHLADSVRLAQDAAELSTPGVAAV
ncbi:hypothetical protein DFH11DRAFT_451381 [Phellopilus nigrolimitatus]|nr:hypothetical protein DFH11DRAFT_451381 [Phellopilus nigrolimitatus]